MKKPAPLWRVANRRQILAGLCALGAGSCIGPSLEKVRTARPLGLASLTVARELAADPAGTLRKARSMGYTHFGFPLGAQSPMHAAPPDPVEMAAHCKDARLNVGVLRLAHSIEYPKQMQLARKLGARIVAQSAADVFFTGPIPGQTTRAAFEGWMARLETMAKAAQAEGLRLVYHNHAWDHVPLDGLTPLELIAQRFAPGEVDFEIDIGWAAVANVDPVALIRDLGPRVLSLHLKDLNRSCHYGDCQQFAAPGEGDLDYLSLIPQLSQLTDAIGYVEVDETRDGMRDAAKGAETFFRALKLSGVEGAVSAIG